jgi:hypothetical protein
MNAEKHAADEVAVPVARATRRNVQSLNSGITDSVTNITPPTAMSTVPPATSVIRCYVATWISWPNVVSRALRRSRLWVLRG